MTISKSSFKSYQKETAEELSRQFESNRWSHHLKTVTKNSSVQQPEGAYFAEWSCSTNFLRHADFTFWDMQIFFLKLIRYKFTNDS